MRWIQYFGIGLGMISLATIARGFANSKRLLLSRETVDIPDLPPRFAGFRLLHLTDIHLGRDAARVAHLLLTIDALDPDLVCLGGDYARNVNALPEIAAFFRGLSQRKRVVAVYGNTDYRDYVPQQERQYWAKMVPFLNNTAFCLEHGGECLWVVGVNDPHSGLDNLPQALRNVPPEAPVILLAHSPEIIRAPLDPRVRLILCGHTHGGQICLPGGRALYNNMPLPPEFAVGSHQIGNATLYISRGVGSTRVPIRLNCPAEITLFTLTRSGEVQR